MGLITGLRAHPKRPSTVVVYLDGRHWMAIPASSAAELSVGMTLGPEAQEALEARAAEATALEKVGRLLARRPQAEMEIRIRLARSGYAPEIVERVVTRLKEAGDLDDEAFARAWVENRQAFRPRSSAMIRAELRRKGIAPEAMEGALKGMDERQAAEDAATRVARKMKDLPPDVRRRRLYEYLARRGFAHETIRAVVRRTGDAAAESESEGTT